MPDGGTPDSHPWFVRVLIAWLCERSSCHGTRFPTSMYASVGPVSSSKVSKSTSVRCLSSPLKVAREIVRLAELRARRTRHKPKVCDSMAGQPDKDDHATTRWSCSCGGTARPTHKLPLEDYNINSLVRWARVRSGAGARSGEPRCRVDESRVDWRHRIGPDHSRCHVDQRRQIGKARERSRRNRRAPTRGDGQGKRGYQRNSQSLHRIKRAQA